MRLGRVFGIEVGLNWTLAVVFLLLSWSLAVDLLPVSAPGQPVALYWWTAVISAVLFLASLLAHELSHAVIARAFHVRVGGITLWLFGGVARLEGEPPSARAEALITFGGPATSFVLGGGLLALGASGWLAAAPLVAAAIGWLGWVNVVLGLFNLLPGFPLDGGRLLAALLWWRWGSRARAIHGAARVGRLIAYALILLGVVAVFASDILDGVWVAALGTFLLAAAGAEETGVTIRTLLQAVPVSAAMSSPVVMVPAWMTVETFLESDAARYHFTTYPLHDRGGRLVGVVRLRRLLSLHPEQRGQRLIDVATDPAELPTAAPGDDLGQVLEKVGAGLERRVLIYDGSELVGILSPVDVARLLALRDAVVSGRPKAAA